MKPGRQDIHPRLGLGPLRLGLSPAEAADLLGAPVSSNTRGPKETRFFANDIAIAFQDGRGFRISVGRRAKGITFQGHDVFVEALLQNPVSQGFTSRIHAVRRGA